MTRIHPLACISRHAALGGDVEIGPFCVIEEGVVIGARCRLASHVVVRSGTTLGAGNQVGEGAVLGGTPQHARAGDECGRLVIGDNNVIREHVTIHRAWHADGRTTIGDENMLMVNAHVAHDCHIGNQVVLVNNVMLAGHVSVGDRAYLGGAAGVHQFCRIGRLAMIGGQAHVSQDVPPFVTLDGISGQVVGLNSVGLRRAGFDREELQTLKAAYRVMYRGSLLWKDMLEVLANTFTTGPASEFHAFLVSGRRGFVRERHPSRSLAFAPRKHEPEDEGEIRKAA